MGKKEYDCFGVRCKNCGSININYQSSAANIVGVSNKESMTNIKVIDSGPGWSPLHCDECGSYKLEEETIHN